MGKIMKKNIHKIIIYMIIFCIFAIQYTSSEPLTSEINRKNIITFLIIDKENQSISGQDIVLSTRVIKPNYKIGKTYWSIEVVLTENGSRQMAKFTSENIGREMGIYINGEEILVARIAEPIYDPRFEISMKNEEEANVILKKINGTK